MAGLDGFAVRGWGLLSRLDQCFWGYFFLVWNLLGYMEGLARRCIKIITSWDYAMYS
jgi:hypothetical protein